MLLCLLECVHLLPLGLCQCFPCVGVLPGDTHTHTPHLGGTRWSPVKTLEGLELLGGS